MMAISLPQLNDELETLMNKRAVLREKHKNAPVMPDDARVEDEQIADRVARIRVLIAQEQQRERDAMFEDTRSYMDDPRRQVPHAINNDVDSRKALLSSGWEIRGGMIWRQTSSRLLAFCPEDVLFGPMPTDDPVAAQHAKQTQAIFQPEYRAAFLKWFRNGGKTAALSGNEQNALSEGTAAEGGQLVPADIQAEILVRRADASVMRRLARIVQTSRDRIQFPAVAPNASSGSVYSSAFVGGMVGERPVNTDAGPTFQQFEIGIKKFEAYTRISNDLIADAASDVIAFLARDGGQNLALVEDNKFLTGAGTGLEPMGLLNTGLATGDVEGSTSDTISNTTSSAGSVPKIIALTYLVPAQYAERASWLMARATQGAIHGLVDGEGRPWWQPAGVAGGASVAPNQLLGSPVFTSPFMPVGGTNANKVLVYGDISAYIIADRTALSVELERIPATDETKIYLRSRAGGGLWNTDAIRVGIV